jgi:starch-binding outer membrane protein, SusD/RagB family
MRRASSYRFRLLAALGVASAATATACNTDRLLTVQRPDIVPIGAVTDKSALPTVYGGVLADFQIGFNGSTPGGNEGVVNYSGILGDEFYITDTFDTRIQIDARYTRPDNANNDAVFRNLARSRQSAEQAAAKFAQLAPTFLAGEVNGFAAQRAEIFNVAGLDYLLFAEIYCSGVPFDSVTSQGAVVGQPGLTTAQMLHTAINRFDSATAVANSITPVSGAATAQLRLARVGKARAYLDLADTYGDAFLDSAIATIGGTAGVPTGFSYLVSHSNNTTRENNGVWAFVNNQVRWGQANQEGNAAAGGNVGLAYRSQFVNGADVRTAFLPAVTGFNGAGNFRTQKYPARETPIVVASGTEARLIEAEAYLRKNDIANWLLKINDPRHVLALNQCAPTASACLNPSTAGGVETNTTAHTTATGLADLTDPGTQAARENLTFAERGFWMYATAHRLGDMRRLIRQIGRPFAAVYATGPYILAGQPGGVYGPAVNLPVPIFEESNGIFKTASCNTAAP